MVAEPKFTTERMICRRLAQDVRTRWDFRFHAMSEMQNDMWPPVTQADVKFMLTNCQVTLVEYNKKDVTWRAVGKDVDGRKFTAVVAVFENERRIKVITVF